MDPLPEDRLLTLRTLCALVCLVAVGVACFETWREKTARAESLQMERELVSATAQTARFEALARGELKRVAVSSSQWEAEQKERSTERPVPNLKARGEAFVHDNPDIPALERAAMKALSQSWPARAARAAGFTPEQTKTFLDRFANERMPVGLETLRLPDPDGFDPAQDAQRNLPSIVGPDANARYQQFMAADTRGYSVWESVNAATDQGIPFTASQTQALIQAVQTAPQVHNQPDWSHLTLPESLGLSSAQVELFQKLQAAQGASQAVRDYWDSFGDSKR